MNTKHQRLIHHRRGYCPKQWRARSQLAHILARWPFWICAAMVAGTAWRILDYCLRYPVWTDEASLNLNIIHRSYGQLLQPLNLNQVAPLFFLWTQKYCIEQFGTSALSIRLLPFIAGMACVPLPWLIYRPAFGRRAALVATALIACSLAPVRLTCDAKPYSIDLFFCLILVGVMIRYLMAPERWRWLIVLCGLAPVAIGFSFPSIFIIAAASLAAGWQIWRGKTFRVLPVWLAFNVLAILAFVMNYLWIIRPQTLKTLPYMASFWQHQFAPHNIAIFWWLIKTSVSEMMSYPFGRNYGFGLLLTPLCLLGGLRLIHSRGWAWGILLAGPFALTFLASLLRHYPFGGAIRLQQHLLPSIAILAAWGLRTALTLLWHKQFNRRMARAVVTGAAVILVVYTFIQMPMDIYSPYGHGFRSMITLRRMIHHDYENPDGHTEVMAIGPAWRTAKQMEPEIVWYLTTQPTPCNSTGRLQKRPLEHQHANLWLLDFWLPNQAPAGRTAIQRIDNQVAESGLHIKLMQNKVHYLGQLGLNYHQVYCQVEHYAH